MKKDIQIPQQVQDFINKNHPRFTAKEFADLTGIPIRTVRNFCTERKYILKDAPIKNWRHEKNRNQLLHEEEKPVKIVRHRAEYNNISSPYGIASELHKP